MAENQWHRLETEPDEAWGKTLDRGWAVTVHRDQGKSGWWYCVWRGEHDLAVIGGAAILEREIAQNLAEIAADRFMTFGSLIPW